MNKDQRDAFEVLVAAACGVLFGLAMALMVGIL